MNVMKKTKLFSPEIRAVEALLILAFLLAGEKVASAAGDVVILNNGDRITGEILEEENSKLKIRTAYAGEISISPANVSRVERDSNPAVAVATTASEMTVPTGKIPLGHDLEFKTGAAEKERKKNWSGSANLSLKLDNGGSKDDTEIDGDFALRWERGTQRFRMRGQVEYDTFNQIPTKQDWMLDPKYDHFFSDKVYGSLSYSVKQQKYEGLDLRQTIGPALGYEFVANEQTELVSEIGVYYTSEDYTSGTPESYAAPGWSLEYRRKILQDRVEFYHRHFFFVRADDMKKKIFHTWTGFKFPIYEGLNLSTEVELDYDDITLDRSSTLEETIRLKFGFEW
jgi:hypothetical protein